MTLDFQPSQLIKIVLDQKLSFDNSGRDSNSITQAYA